jgi:hypothetical protein
VELISDPEVIEVLLSALFESLQDQSHVASNSCWTISRLVNAAFSMVLDQEDGEPDTFILSDYYENIVEVLIDASVR